MKQLSSELRLPECITAVLVQRGLKTSDAALDFLNPSLSKLYSPFLMNDMNLAVERIRDALKHQERILICGDYDVDGITSVALLKKSLARSGLDVIPHLPNRLLDGYGFHLHSVEYALSLGATLIITVDCGVSSREAVDSANRLGIDVIITDHHEPNGELPDAAAVLNPKRIDSTYPDSNLAGIGVTYKLVQGLIEAGLIEFPLVSMLELVALGTVADVAPLIGENRIFVYHGLEALTHTSHPGLKALMKIAGVPLGKKIDPISIGFQIGPRINAVGRLGSPDQALNLLITESPETAQQLSEELNNANNQRHAIEETILKSAEKQLIDLNLLNDPFLTVSGENWHEGVIGIVASKLADKYYRPTCVISTKDGLGRGSGRSIPDFSLFDCLKDVSEHLLEFGGHHIAAGFRIAAEQIEIFRKKCSMIASERINPENSLPKISIDYPMKLNELSFETIRKLEALSPYGLGNSKPRFLFENLHHRFAPKGVGSDSSHLKLMLTDGDRNIDGIAFGFGKHLSQIQNTGIFSVVATPDINVWNGREIIQLNIVDFDLGGN